VSVLLEMSSLMDLSLEAAALQFDLSKRMSAISVLRDISLKISHASRHFNFLDELKESIVGRLVETTPRHSRRYVIFQ
jgi:hypothetical protein